MPPWNRSEHKVLSELILLHGERWLQIIFLSCICVSYKNTVSKSNIYKNNKKQLNYRKKMPIDTPNPVSLWIKFILIEF